MANVKIDPAVLQAVREAKPFKPHYLGPIIRQAACLGLFIPAALALLPYWILRGVLPFIRPHPEWSLVQTIGVLLIRRFTVFQVLFGAQPAAPREGGWRDQTGVLAVFLDTINSSGPGGSVRVPRSVAVKAIQEKTKRARGSTTRLDVAWFDPAPLEFFRGVLSIKTPSSQQKRVSDSEAYKGLPILDAKWAKTRTRGLWFMAAPNELPPVSSASAKKRDVFLYFHGGAGAFYNAGDPFMGGQLATNLALKTGLDVFSVDYTLAPDGPFPATLSQALAAWLYLTREVGYKASQIIIGGDSFGSHLSLQLERYLSYELPKVAGLSSDEANAKPKAYLLLSPWLNLNEDRFPSFNTNRGTDILVESFAGIGIRWMGFERNGVSLKDPFVSGHLRSSDDYARLPPTLVINGGLETLIDEGKAFVAGARAAGAKVDHLIERLEPHDYFVLPSSLGATLRSFEKVGQWVKTL